MIYWVTMKVYMDRAPIQEKFDNVKMSGTAIVSSCLKWALSYYVEYKKYKKNMFPIM